MTTICAYNGLTSSSVTPSTFLFFVYPSSFSNEACKLLIKYADDAFHGLPYPHDASFSVDGNRIIELAEWSKEHNPFVNPQNVWTLFRPSNVLNSEFSVKPALHS